MGCSAYIFKSFAPRFTDNFHVIALDRRGHGDSDHPETGYDTDTLTEDLRQFLDTLKIDQVILAGHSMARIELSRFAALYPERVLKLVFLDAAYDIPRTVTNCGFANRKIEPQSTPGTQSEGHFLCALRGKRKAQKVIVFSIYFILSLG